MCLATALNRLNGVTLGPSVDLLQGALPTNAPRRYESTPGPSDLPRANKSEFERVNISQVSVGVYTAEGSPQIGMTYLEGTTLGPLRNITSGYCRQVSANTLGWGHNPHEKTEMSSCATLDTQITTALTIIVHNFTILPTEYRNLIKHSNKTNYPPRLYSHLKHGLISKVGQN